MKLCRTPSLLLLVLSSLSSLSSLSLPLLTLFPLPAANSNPSQNVSPSLQRPAARRLPQHLLHAPVHHPSRSRTRLLNLPPPPSRRRPYASLPEPNSPSRITDTNPRALPRHPASALALRSLPQQRHRHRRRRAGALQDPRALRGLGLLPRRGRVGELPIHGWSTRPSPSPPNRG